MSRSISITRWSHMFESQQLMSCVEAKKSMQVITTIMHMLKVKNELTHGLAGVVGFSYAC